MKIAEVTRRTRVSQINLRIKTKIPFRILPDWVCVRHRASEREWTSKSCGLRCRPSKTSSFHGVVRRAEWNEGEAGPPDWRGCHAYTQLTHNLDARQREWTAPELNQYLRCFGWGAAGRRPPVCVYAGCSILVLRRGLPGGVVGPRKSSFPIGKHRRFSIDEHFSSHSSILRLDEKAYWILILEYKKDIL